MLESEALLVFGMTYVLIIILGNDIQETLIDCGFDTVKLANVGMLNPVYKHLTSQHEKERSQNLPRPTGQDRETVRKY